MKVILCGYNWSGCKALELLLSEKHDVFVFTHESPYHVPSLPNLCKKLNINFSLENITVDSLPYVPDAICSIYYRNIISQQVIDCCNGKIFNLHPSLLPKYRGCSSLTWAMINGEDETGFTYHYIDENCDTGDILLQERIKIEKWDNQQTLYMRTMFESMKYFLKVFEMVIDDAMGTPQKGVASYYPRECPNNCQIDPDWSLEKIENYIRAMIYPPYAPAQLGTEPVYSLEDYFKLVDKK